jgi:hypothetical protein
MFPLDEQAIRFFLAVEAGLKHAQRGSPSGREIAKPAFRRREPDP